MASEPTMLDIFLCLVPFVCRSFILEAGAAQFGLGPFLHDIHTIVPLMLLFMLVCQRQSTSMGFAVHVSKGKLSIRTSILTSMHMQPILTSIHMNLRKTSMQHATDSNIDSQCFATKDAKSSQHKMGG